MENNDIYEKYEGLVKSIAKKYINNGISFEDLVHHGYVGLWQASEKFNESLGYEFSTYATNWIKNAIEDEIYKLSDLSKYKTQQVNKMKKIESELIQDLKRSPTDKELAEKMGISVEKIIELKKLSQQNISLDSEIENDSDATYYNFTADQSMTPDEQFIYKEDMKDSELIKEAFLKTLLPHEREVFCLRHDKEMNLTDTAKTLRTYRKRICDIENKISEKSALFFESKEYIEITTGKSEKVLKRIIDESKKNIDASVNGEKIAEYENYENLKEVDFQDLLTRFQIEYETVLKFPTFKEYFKDVCKKFKITSQIFTRATGLSEPQFSNYKSSKATPSLSALVALGIYCKISTHTIETLVELAGYRFKVNDKTHMAYKFVLEQLKGYPIEYCNKILELLGVEEGKLLKNNKKK